MSQPSIPLSAARKLVAAVSLGLAAATGSAAVQPPAKTDIGFVDLGAGITLRRMVVRSPNPKGAVLFLHGFPETLYVWKDIATALGSDYEVHAFDWPGYGLSSRPLPGNFAYSPRDYAKVLKDYIAVAGIDKSRLLIYATDIGALPALLLALDDPAIASRIVVGDFAPFDRPQYMYASLQGLKAKETADAIHAHMNKTRDEILANAHRRGLSEEEQFDIAPDCAADMAQGWDAGGLTSADAFYLYYSHFTRDQNELEANIGRLKTPIQVIWGEKDLYIKAEMGAEFAGRINTALKLLPGLGHYPHLQNPAQTVEEVRALLAPRSPGS